MSSQVIFIALIFVIGANSICADPNQIDGQCSSCSGIDFLLQGRCYPKMKGCLNYTLPGPKCAICQSGYLMDGFNMCKRQAVLMPNGQLDLTAPDIPPVIPDNPDTLNYSEIIAAVGKQDAPYVTDANEIFLSSHPQLGLGNIKLVNKLQTKKGMFYTINYQSSINGALYQGVAFLNTSSQITPLYFKLAQAQPRDPFTADNLVRQALGTKLNDFFLYEIRFISEVYYLFYLNSGVTVNLVQFNRTDIGPFLGSKLIVRSLLVADLAKQFLLNKFVELIPMRILSLTKYDEFYAFVFNSDITASVRFRNYAFEANKPLQTSVYAPDFDSYSYPLFNNDFTEPILTTDTKYRACIQAAVNQLPELGSAKFVLGSISKQNNKLPSSADQNLIYAMSLETSFLGDYYDVYVYYSANNIVRLLYVLKNGYSTLYNEKYNYNSDTQFFRAYINASVTSKVQGIPAIESVVMKLVGPSTPYFRIIFSPQQYMQFKYNRTSNVTTLLSYTVQGDNILYILGVLNQTTEKAQPKLYLDYLTEKQNTTANNDLSFFASNSLEAILSYVTNQGTYQANIGNSNNQFAIKYNSLVSSTNCFDFTQVNKNKSWRLEKFIRDNYNLIGYEIRLIQSRVNRVGKSYRVLLSNKKSKQIEFIIDELFTLLNVIGTRTFNQGYELIEPVAGDSDYVKMTSFLSSSNLAGNKVPFMTQSNVKSIRSFYNDGKITYKVLIDKISGSNNVQTYLGQTVLKSSTCLSSDANGRCLTCSTNRVEYQGVCWDRLEGCKVQAQNQCLRCNDPYVLLDKRCKKNCMDLIPLY